MSDSAITLTPEELHIIKLLREKQFQELTIKVQDGVIVMIERIEKFARKKNGKMF
jgi:hypothetical protein